MKLWIYVGWVGCCASVFELKAEKNMIENKTQENKSESNQIKMKQKNLLK